MKCPKFVPEIARLNEVCYKSSLDKFDRAKKDPKCTAKQKQSIEDLESKISGQIYWATKFGSI